MLNYLQIGPVVFVKEILKLSPHRHIEKKLAHPLVTYFLMDHYNLSNLGRGSHKDLLCQIIFKEDFDKEDLKKNKK